MLKQIDVSSENQFCHFRWKKSMKIKAKCCYRQFAEFRGTKLSGLSAAQHNFLSVNCFQQSLSVCARPSTP